MRDDRLVRTTLDIDEDVLRAAKELAALRRTTAGKVLSELAREALRPSPGDDEMRNGVPLLPGVAGERAVTRSAVAKLRDDEL